MGITLSVPSKSKASIASSKSTDESKSAEDKSKQSAPKQPGGYMSVNLKQTENGSWQKTKTHGLWLIWSCLLAVGLVRQAHATTNDAHQAYNSNIAVAFICTLLTGLMLLTSFAPYIGIKTQATFTMFSNLTVEGGQTNHFFYRPWMAVFDLLEDVCIVTDSSLDRIKYYMRKTHTPTGYTSMRPLIQRLKLECSSHGNSRCAPNAVMLFVSFSRSRLGRT